MMDPINFAQIAPRCGGQQEAFEELCCQLARNSRPPGSSFVRLRGAGGDGGVECYADLAHGSRIGWQARFLFNIDSLLTQLTASLNTALRIHPTLTRYVVCFPFNLTGPTGRTGQSGIEKFNAWRKKREASACEARRQLTIEDWPASNLLAELLRIDHHGGMRAFFFDATVLSNSWFEKHISDAARTAGPRYAPELSVETNLWKWFSALGCTEEWSQTFRALLKPCDTELETLRAAVARDQGTLIDPAWPKNLEGKAETCIAELSTLLSACSALIAEPSRDGASRCLTGLAQSLVELSELESQLKEDLESQHGEGADSPGFRQFMSEYEVSLPAANLDSVRDLIKVINNLAEWLNSPAAWPAFESTLLLLGIAGSGKTHGVCDAAARRLLERRLSIVTFGHLFGGEPDSWTRLRECLGLPGILGRDGLLDALNSAAEASGHIMIIWLDAINETKPLRYWRERLLTFADVVSRRPFLRVCATCRTSYAAHCIPEGDALYRAEHRGFAGIEREACRAFFAHYDLDPPITPILQPELANPLYLKLICKTLKAKGLRSLPAGWWGLSTAIQAFLAEKNRAYALEHEMSESTAVASTALSAIAREIARLGETSLNWSAADRTIRESIAISAALRPIDWLIREDLLIEDAPRPGAAIDAESVVRPAFERLGDFLIAQEVLAQITPGEFQSACSPGGRLASYVGSREAVADNEGVVSALSILVPEQFARGAELPDFFDEGPARSAVLKATVSSYLWRDPSSFTPASEANLRQALGMRGYAAEAMDAALAVSCQPPAIDVGWLDVLLRERPMALRDAFWCWYLHESYEDSGSVRRLIDATLELPIAQVEDSVAGRWVTVLLWFTAAADRRVKDHASRAATAVLRIHKNLVPSAVRRMMDVDDDAVRERTLVAAYGACLLTKDPSVLDATCDVLAESLASRPASFHNALLRDHARTIAELARVLGVHGKPERLLALLDGLLSPWPLEIPTDGQIKAWDDLPKLAHSCLADDFFTYSMGCLDEWTQTVAKRDMAKCILRRIVEDFRYAGSGCERYDSYMLGLHGGGRAKPTWAERIGKKYQWIAMYQLAARLSDHAVRKRNDWEPELLRKPLILIEERQLDPTLPRNIAHREREVMPWWIPASVDLSASETLSDGAWVGKRDDVPTLSRLLALTHNDGKKWLLLNGYPSWGSRPDHAPYNTPYRNLWVHVRGYLVEPSACENGFASLAGRNFFGRWMREGASWLYGFAGEYPWGPAFNTEPEWYNERGGNDSDLPCSFIPVCSEVVAEWEYDASLPRNLHIPVPARVFFEPGDLWWNGQDGFLQEHGETAFRAAGVTEPGPSALIVNYDDLLQRLKRINKRLIWTLLGEKIILGGPHDTVSPRCTFSQVATLNEDGSIRSSELTFFEDYQQATGPLDTTKRSRTHQSAFPQEKKTDAVGSKPTPKNRRKGKRTPSARPLRGSRTKTRPKPKSPNNRRKPKR
ncbi:MAG: hypothetical protein LAO04_22090 [Acidobacteriia bacterium]|nr:hypothetical protein [Terriglobia bacterium]